MDEKKKKVVKLCISAVALVLIVLAVYLLFKELGLTDLNKEQVQEFIQATGAIAPLVFIGVSFVQVTLIPIPGMVTILAGNYLFGMGLSFLYSYIGMTAGAVFGFYLGRWIGRPFVNWLAGSKEEVDGWIARLKGRETVFLFFAFLLPLFPDDLLCSLAGLLTMKFSTFLVMQIITRATSIGATLLFMSGEVIPFESWGLVVLGGIAIVCVVAFVFAMKYSEKINAFFDNMIQKIVRVFEKKDKEDKSND